MIDDREERSNIVAEYPFTYDECVEIPENPQDKIAIDDSIFVKEFIEQTLDNAPKDDTNKVLIEAEIQPKVMPSFPTFHDMFRLTIENINIHYHYGCMSDAGSWKGLFKTFFKMLLLIDPPYKRIEADLFIRHSTDLNSFIYFSHIKDLRKQLKSRNWNKLRNKINEFSMNYYEKKQKEYRKELRDWYNKRKENKNVKNN